MLDQRIDRGRAFGRSLRSIDHLKIPMEKVGSTRSGSPDAGGVRRVGSLFPNGVVFWTHLLSFCHRHDVDTSLQIDLMACVFGHFRSCENRPNHLQSLASCSTLWRQVNPKGGAIALGHPLGATGARQIATLLPELKRQNKKPLGVGRRARNGSRWCFVGGSCY